METPKCNPCGEPLRTIDHDPDQLYEFVILEDAKVNGTITTTIKAGPSHMLAKNHEQARMKAVILAGVASDEIGKYRVMTRCWYF